MDELTSIPQILTDLVFRGSLSRHTSKNDEYNIFKTFFKCITKFDLKKKKKVDIIVRGQNLWQQANSKR